MHWLCDVSCGLLQAAAMDGACLLAPAATAFLVAWLLLLLVHLLSYTSASRGSTGWLLKAAWRLPVPGTLLFLLLPVG